MGSALEAAYGDQPVSRRHGCDACSVTWFGPEGRCWVCGADTDADGSVVAVAVAPVLDSQVGVADADRLA